MNPDAICMRFITVGSATVLTERPGNGGHGGPPYETGSRDYVACVHSLVLSAAARNRDISKGVQKLLANYMKCNPIFVKFLLFDQTGRFGGQRQR
jgi:hypothetical protein